jgi:hypothetical protein
MNAGSERWWASASRADSHIIKSLPSTASTWPVMKAASPEARKATALAISSVVLKRPSGVRSVICLWSLSGWSALRWPTHARDPSAVARRSSGPLGGIEGLDAMKRGLRFARTRRSPAAAAARLCPRARRDTGQLGLGGGREELDRDADEIAVEGVPGQRIEAGQVPVVVSAARVEVARRTAVVEQRAGPASRGIRSYSPMADDR